MNFTKTIINAIKIWVMQVLNDLELRLKGGVKYSEAQTLTDAEKQTARDNIGVENAVVDTMLTFNVLPVLVDGDGAVLADDDGAILLNL